MNEEKKNHIPGIFNYCDRWCERCSFTSRCLLFSNESRIASFEIMNNRLPNAEEYMEQIFCIDDEESDEEDDFFGDDADDEILFKDDQDEDNDELIEDENEKEKTLLENLSHEYLLLSTELIKKLDKQFNFSSTIIDNISFPQLKNIHNNFEIIAWYHAFIFVKIKRALSSKRDYEKEKDEESKEISAHDMNGTAKVAFLSVQNSLKALNDLVEYLPEHGVEIVKLSTLCKKIFNEIEKEFPGYKNFIRPGLDEHL